MEPGEGLKSEAAPGDPVPTSASAPYSMNGHAPPGSSHQHPSHNNDSAPTTDYPSVSRETYVQYASTDAHEPAANNQYHFASHPNPADSDLQQIEEKVYAMDAELVKLQEMTADAKTHEEDPESISNAAQVEGDDNAVDSPDEEMNRRSVYVGNVDYGSTPQELQEHFNRCGTIFRVTIMVDKYSGHPKGFAYIEFADASAANNALLLSNTTLRGRTIKVLPKRKNIAGMTRGRPYGRGRGRGAMMFGGPYGMAPAFMGQPMRGTVYAPKFRRGRTFRIA